MVHVPLFFSIFNLAIYQKKYLFPFFSAIINFTMTSELVSIITPCYNSEKYLAQTIESVLAQTYTNWELIIIDDGSTDSSVKIAKAYQEKKQNIAVFQKENSGSSESRNYGLKILNGRYIALLDSDDVWHKDYLETMLENIGEYQQKSEDGVIYFSGYCRMNQDLSKAILEDYSCPGIFSRKDLFRHCPIFPSACLIDLEKIPPSTLFQHDLKSCRDDYAFFLDLLKEGKKAVGFPQILVDYRMREDSITSNKFKMIKPQWNIYRKVLKLNLLQSLYYLSTWALNGLKKYSKK